MPKGQSFPLGMCWYWHRWGVHVLLQTYFKKPLEVKHEDFHASHSRCCSGCSSLWNILKHPCFLKPVAWRSLPRKPTSAQREGLLEKWQAHHPAAPGDRSGFAAPVPPHHAVEAKDFYFLKSSTSAVLLLPAFATNKVGPSAVAFEEFQNNLCCTHYFWLKLAK